MKKNDFARYISSFLTDHLVGTRNLSANTIVSYRDAFVILIILHAVKIYSKLPVGKVLAEIMLDEL